MLGAFAPPTSGDLTLRTRAPKAVEVRLEQKRPGGRCAEEWKESELARCSAQELSSVHIDQDDD